MRRLPAPATHSASITLPEWQPRAEGCARDLEPAQSRAKKRGTTEREIECLRGNPPRTLVPVPVPVLIPRRVPVTVKLITTFFRASDQPYALHAHLSGGARPFPFSLTPSALLTRQSSFRQVGALSNKARIPLFKTEHVSLTPRRLTELSVKLSVLIAAGSP